MQRAWNQFCGKLGAKGVKRSPHEGPLDYSERAARSLPSAEQPIRRIAALYMALRYGRERSAAQEQEFRRRVRELEFG